MDTGTAPMLTTSCSAFPTAAAMIASLQRSEPVYCLYPELLTSSARCFLNGFPGHTMYAIKANSHPTVLKTLYDAGIRKFDTASLPEIETIKDLFPDAVCYFMAPCKLIGAAETAFQRFGVRHFVADHASEVERLLQFADHSTTIHVRMKALDPASVYELSSKFGAEESETVRLLSKVAASGLRPGLAFKVGSLCRHSDAYRRALGAAATVARKSGAEIASLDVGGGSHRLIQASILSRLRNSLGR